MTFISPFISRALCLATLTFAVVVLANGCIRTDEKEYNGKTRGDCSLYYELSLKHIGNNDGSYQLMFIPDDMDEFFGGLNKKWHQETRLKLALQEKMKRYCEETNSQSICDNLAEITREIEERRVTLIFNVKLYDHKNNVVGNISGNITNDLKNRDLIKEKLVAIASKFDIDRTTFRKVDHVELQITL